MQGEFILRKASSVVDGPVSVDDAYRGAACDLAGVRAPDALVPTYCYLARAIEDAEKLAAVSPVGFVVQQVPSGVVRWRTGARRSLAERLTVLRALVADLDPYEPRSGFAFVEVAGRLLNEEEKRRWG